MYINNKYKKSSLSFILFLTVVLTLTAITSSLSAATTSITASKTVDNATPSIGSQVEYTIKVENTGTAILNSVSISENVLPTGLTYVASSSTQSGPVGGFTITPFSTIASEPATGLAWTIDSLQPGVEVVITYKATVGAVGTLTNSGTVSHSSLGASGTPINVNVAATNTPTYTLYMPIIFKSPPAVTLNAIPYTFNASSWTLSWTPSSTSTGVTYEVQEDDNASFSSPLVLATQSATSYSRSAVTSSTGNLYYRIRAIQNGVNGAWSNTEVVSFEYYDTFTSSTGWEIRRSKQTPNARSITSGNLRVTSDSAWSNIIVSPHVKAPGSNYTITTNALMHQRQDNHHFGIIFGGQHDSGCTATSGVNTDCFDEFYLLDVQHRYVSGSSLYDPAIYEFKIDRVEYTGGNSFNRVEQITSWKSTDLDVEDSHEWEIDVDTNGDFSISADGDVLKTGTVDDASLLNNGYFGVVVMADGNGSARTDFSDFRVKAD